MSEANNPLAWVEKAEEDFALAKSAIQRKKPLLTGACFHAQQCAEKYIKALLVSKKADFPKTHDLDALRNLIPDGWQLKPDHPDLASLTEWAVEARYPGDWPEAVEGDARLAVEKARTVSASVEEDLMRRGFEFGRA